MKRTNAKLEKHIERLRVTLNNKTQTNGHRNRPASRSSKNGLKEKAVEDMYQEIEELQARLVNDPRQVQCGSFITLHNFRSCEFPRIPKDLKILPEFGDEIKKIHKKPYEVVKVRMNSRESVSTLVITKIGSQV